MEITRFVHEGISYRVGVNIAEFGGIRIPSPWFSITSKSARRNREELPPDKGDRHYMRFSVKNPIGFYRKVYKIYDEFFADWNYVSFTAHRDDKEKRNRVYQKALEKMGFRVAYVYTCPWDKSWVEHFMARPGYSLKKKEIKRLIKAAYGNWEWNGEYWEEK